MRLKGFQKLTSVDNALKRFLAAFQIEELRTINAPTHSVLNRVLAEDIIAGTDLPRFDRSAVDGFAVRAEDTVGATQFRPTILQLTHGDVIGHKQTKTLWTGNAIPKGANAVVMLENTEWTKNKLQIWSPVTPGENISKKGEDIHKGKVAVEAGTRLKPRHLGLIAALGVVEIKVFEKPRIAVLTTGDELVELGGKLRENNIFDINKLVLSALCCELGAEPLDLGISNDEVDEVSSKLKIGLTEADAVITSGGTSVGGSDLVPEAVNKIGRPGVIVHGVAMRPGMPTALALIEKKPILILPGNPVAAMIGFEVFARPVISKMLGMKEEEPRFTAQAKMTRRMATTLGRRNFVRVRAFIKNGELLAEPISARGSSIISTMTRANGYVAVPENREGLEEGESVSVHLFDNVSSL